MEHDIDLRVYWNIFLRRWWILLLATVMAASATYFISNNLTPKYAATSKILVQGAAGPGNPSLSDIQASRQLAQTYEALIRTRPILEQVIESLSLPYGPGTLSGNTKTAAPGSLVVIRVIDIDPQMAAEIANEITGIFIRDFRDKQFLQIAQFQASLEQYGISGDPGIIAAQASTLSTLRIAEPAIPNSSPIGPQTRVHVVIAAILGLMAGILVVFLLEFLDDRVKSPQEVAALTGSVPLGIVPQIRSREGLNPVMLGDEHFSTPLAESYKFLRTNLRFASLGTQGFRSLLVTSANPEEGKTTIAANLSIAAAKEGKSVILVDSDLRRPALHRIFDLQGNKGLTHLIIGDSTLEDAMVPTSIEGLRVVPSGPVPHDATLILDSSMMKDVVEQMKNHADLVVFDSPPLLAVTDPMLLVPQVDGIILVINTQRTRRGAVRRGTEILWQAKPGFVGVVLNKVNSTSRGSYSYTYYYYSPSYGVEDGANQRQKPLRKFRSLAKKLMRR